MTAEAHHPLAATLPVPTLARWQPLRLGLVNLYYYDSEEFHFRDGRLLLRGNNGTGKSKVLSLTLPFLLDAQIRPSRIEPDGDNTKKMAWNLLLGRYERRMGYSWIEFGRVDADGQPRYLTLGCGLSAVTARSHVDAWYFTVDQHRVGESFWLMNPKRVVLTREKLNDTLQRFGGQLFRSARDYRRAVDEQLFQLGQGRYDALMDTLVQLRQPQLSKKPDESSLSLALTEALPPIAPALLADVADALTQLEEFRQELQDYESLSQAVGQFNQRYQRYAATQARRQARHVRQAQTQFDQASRAVNEQHQALADAQAVQAQAEAGLHQAERQRAMSQTRVDTLKSDPAMADARTLNDAAQEARRCHQAVTQAQAQQHVLIQRYGQEQAAATAREASLQQKTQALDESQAVVVETAAQAGLFKAYQDSVLGQLIKPPLSDSDEESASSDAGSPLSAEGAASLVVKASLPMAELDAALAELRRARDVRQEQIRGILRRCADAERAQRVQQTAQIRRDECQDDLDVATARREAADALVNDSSRAHLDAWQQYLERLRQLQVPQNDTLMEDLGAWTLTLSGDSPARVALWRAQQGCNQKLARRHVDLQAQQQALDAEQAQLREEQTQLQKGRDHPPQPAPWRLAQANHGLSGVPFWQLVDFQQDLSAAQRSGLEAALQAAGLLDAWIEPAGGLVHADGRPVAGSAWWQVRPALGQSLADWLVPAQQSDLPDDPVVQQAWRGLRSVLAGIACGEQDDLQAEAWVSPQGRFRLGALNGAWEKPQAQFIGHAARQTARAQRLQAIDTRLQCLRVEQQALAQQRQQLRQAQEQAEAEWHDAPSDADLRAAHARIALCVQACSQAQERLQQAVRQWEQAHQALSDARQVLRQDSEDVHLPDTPEALHEVAHSVQHFSDALAQLALTLREQRQASQEWSQQAQRMQQASEDAQQAAEQTAASQIEADQAQARLDTLQASIGAQVQALQAALQAASQALARAESDLGQAHRDLREAAEARARAEQKAEIAQTHLMQQTAHRQQVVAGWQQFADTGLLASALPAQDIPAQRDRWAVETALTLARRVEQALATVPDDNAAWGRVQEAISRDYTELGRAMTALGHLAQAETSDFGLVVRIVYQNRPERPDQLALRLDEEIIQRRELLTAREREILETHLQAEISSAIQKRLREAQQQILAINQELHQRPTTTGVRFRLKWETLPEGADGAPVGLAAARQQLLNTSTDLWSAEDRRVVGEMLQQRIEAERSRSDVLPGGSLLEQLSRALDYRRWHRFRIERWDGAWRSLSGPASSGERALGLTVPLFAAVSSFYAHDSLAPRLVLLDEVFAGIDNPARAHCWALIREFDLDFVVTSEREWACSVELPGVAIAQLQRREGIEAVHVSRWVWDGRARRPDAEPGRRFPPTQEAPRDELV